MPSLCDGPTDLDGLIQHIREQKENRQTREHEYYVDIDPLRHRYVTKDQFKRYLEQHFGVTLNAKHEEVLFREFGEDKWHWMVNYEKFNKAIAPQYDTCNFDEPAATEQSSRLPKTAFSATAPINTTAVFQAEDVMMRIAKVYKTHEIDLRASYCDFDTHNRGTVTESQFLRNFPGAPNHTIAQEDKLAIAEMYRHPMKREQVKYFLWWKDMEILVNSLRLDATAPQKLHAVPKMEKRELTVPEIVMKIRNTIYLQGIRTNEYFKDHDKLRCGNVTRPQFIRGISDCCGRQAQLTDGEMNRLADALTVNDIGHCQYSDFCKDMEHAYTCSEMEKHPTLDLMRPPQGALYTVPNMLAEPDESNVQEILDDLAKIVKEKRIMLHAYAKDFDHSQHYTSGITKTQFSRELKNIKLILTEKQLDLVCQKFEVTTNHGDVHYPSFCQRIDPEFVRTAEANGSWNTTRYEN